MQEGRCLLINEQRLPDGGIITIALDITEHKRAGEALRERDARLRHLESELLHVSRATEIGQLSSALAHELNQPLTAIMNYVEAALRSSGQGDMPMADTIDDYLRSAVDQVGRATDIIDRLRRIYIGRALEQREENPSEVISDACDLALIGTASRDLRTELDFPNDAPAVWVDKIQIQQVVLNIIQNAVEAMADSIIAN